MKAGINGLRSSSKTSVLFFFFYFIALLISAIDFCGFACPVAAFAEEQFTYVEDGEFSRQIHIPTYEWIPKDPQLKGIIFACHRPHFARQNFSSCRAHLC